MPRTYAFTVAGALAPASASTSLRGGGCVSVRAPRAHARRHAPARMSATPPPLEAEETPVDDELGAPLEDCKLFVGNLSWNTTDNTLGVAFSRYGNVVHARVITDRFTGKSRGFGFIEYESAGEAADALEGMQGFEVDGRRVRVDRANKRPSRPRAPRNDDVY